MPKYTPEILQDAVSNSTSIKQVLEHLGLKYAGGNHSHIKKKISELKIDTSHFLGQGHNKGKTFSSKRKPIEFYLIKDCPVQITSHCIRLRLIKEGLKEPRCECCGSDTWLGREIPLELHHVNGNHFDNRIENLQILCPNCHALC